MDFLKQEFAKKYTMHMWVKDMRTQFTQWTKKKFTHLFIL